MGEEQIAVIGEEACYLGELRLVDVFVIAEAQVADVLDIDQLLHLRFKRADAGLQVGSHVDRPPGSFVSDLVAGLCNTALALAQNGTKRPISRSFTRRAAADIDSGSRPAKTRRGMDSWRVG